MPEGHNADAFRSAGARRPSTSRYGASFGHARRQVVPHRPSRRHQRLTMLMGALAGTEMALSLAGVPHQEGRRAGGDGFPRRPKRKAWREWLPSSSFPAGKCFGTELDLATSSVITRRSLHDELVELLHDMLLAGELETRREGQRAGALRALRRLAHAAARGPQGAGLGRPRHAVAEPRRQRRPHHARRDRRAVPDHGRARGSRRRSSPAGASPRPSSPRFGGCTTRWSRTTSAASPASI